MDRKIEEKIRIMHKNMSELYAHENFLISPAEMVKAIFPEAFAPEKHPAIMELDRIIDSGYFVLRSYEKEEATIDRLKRVRFYFNDDGTLKDGQRGGV